MKKLPKKLDRKSSRFLHTQLKDLLVTQLRDRTFKPGDKMPSEEQLAKTYQINRATIRRALRDLITEGLIYRVPATGTFVSDPKAMDPEFVRVGKGAAQVAWLMKTEKGLVLGPFHTEMFETANMELRKLRYHLVFFSIDDAASSTELMKRINKKEFAGIMMIGWMDPKLIESLVRAEIPAILVDNYVRGLQLDSILPDNEGGAYEAVRYLLDRGHERIACIRAPLDQAAARERYRGYVNALSDAGIAADENLVVEGNFQVDGGERAMAQLLELKKNRPTAVFCLNDEMAIGAMKKIRQSGLKVPDQISVIGFDDVDWAAHTFPPLSTVQVPKGELASAAIKLLLQRMKAPQATPYKVLLPTALIERDSVGKQQSK